MDLAVILLILGIAIGLVGLCLSRDAATKTFRFRAGIVLVAIGIVAGGVGYAILYPR